MYIPKALMYLPVKPEHYQLNLARLCDSGLSVEEISKRIDKSVEWINGVLYRQEPYWSEVHQIYDEKLTECVKQNWPNFSPEQLASGLGISVEEVRRRYYAERTN